MSEFIEMQNSLESVIGNKLTVSNRLEIIHSLNTINKIVTDTINILSDNNLRTKHVSSIKNLNNKLKKYHEITQIKSLSDSNQFDKWRDEICESLFDIDPTRSVVINHLKIINILHIDNDNPIIFLENVLCINIINSNGETRNNSQYKIQDVDHLLCNTLDKTLDKLYVDFMEHSYCDFDYTFDYRDATFGAYYLTLLQYLLKEYIGKINNKMTHMPVTLSELEYKKFIKKKVKDIDIHIFDNAF